MKSRWLCAIGCAFGVCASAARGSEHLGVTGGPEIAWSYREMSGRDGENRLWRFVYRETEHDRRLGWRFCFSAGEVVGDVRVVAARGHRLHVWYGDGTHRWYAARRSGAGQALPDSAVPLAVIGGGSNDPLYALVRRSVALAIAPDESIEPEDAEQTEEIEPPAPRWPESKWVLVRLEKGRWHGDRGMPAGFDPKAGVWLTATAPRVEVVYGSSENDRGYLLLASDDADGEWSPAVLIAELAGAELLAVGTSDTGPVLIAGREGRSAISAIRRIDGAWTAGSPFLTGNSEALQGEGAVFAVSGERVVGVWTVEDGAARSAEWNVADGEAVAEAVRLRALQPGPDGQSSDWLRVMLAYVILALVLVAVYVRRRESVVDGVTLPPPYQLVGHGRRLTAFGIDAILYTPCIMFFFNSLLEGFDNDAEMLHQATLLDPSVMRDLTWRWVCAVAGFAVYTTIFETWWSATPGKRVMGLRVVDEHGDRCGFGRIVARNMLRGVEFFPFMDLLPTLVLIFLTKNRQRLGDLIGGTLVVQRIPPPQEQREPE